MTHERTPLELVALAAWLNVTPEQLPQQYRAHTCIATMAAWRRVVDAMREHIEGGQAAEIERLCKELDACAGNWVIEADEETPTR